MPENARRAPAWLYVQDQGNGMVSFVGASRVDEIAHPFRYGSERTHQFVVGAVIIVPSLVVATDTLIGQGLQGLALQEHDVDAMLTRGERLVDTTGGA